MCVSFWGNGVGPANNYSLHRFNWGKVGEEGGGGFYKFVTKILHV